MSALQARIGLEPAEGPKQQAPEPLIKNPSVRAGEVWLGIHFPKISLSAHSAPDDAAFAVLELQQGKTRVYRMNSLAQQQGLEAGMLSSAAHALCQELKMAKRDEAAELKQLQVYARRLTRFTPRISLSQPDTLLLEVRSGLRLFGGLKSLHRQLKAVFPGARNIACAPVADAAELMARQAINRVIRNTDQLRAALGEIKLARTPIKQKLVQKLARCGLHSLRDIWRLPRADLARRFGADLLHYLDQLSGQRQAPRRWFEIADYFEAEYGFEQETRDQRYLLYAAELLLQQARLFLQTRASVSEKIRFRLIYSRQHGTARRWMPLNVFAQQGGDRPEHFLPQLREQLQNLQFESPLNSIELRIDQFRACVGSNYDLFKKTPQVTDDNWPVLLDLLFARLGPKRVYRLDMAADFRPERAWQKRAVRGPSCRKQLNPQHPERPTWLFGQAVKCPGQGFKLISDAERLESGWWEERDQRREYYQGIAPSGRRCWLYRDLQAANGQWYLHGLFA